MNFDSGVSLAVDPPGVVEQWFLDFAAPFSMKLIPGEYLGATRFSFQADADPGLNVSGYGRGLNQLLGEFTVYDVAYDTSGVQRFAASFVQQELNFDGTLDPPLHGVIVFNSTFGAGGGVLANDTDVEGDLLPFAALVSGPAHGALFWNGDGTFTYTPDANFHGTDSFTYRTGDGQDDSNVATVSITVSAVEDTPADHDFNGDGKSDILLQHDSGLPVIWTMDGTTITGGAVLPNVGPTWHVAAAADFNGDGKADILGQHDSGLPVIWTMDGTTITGGAVLPNVGPTWHFAAAADFSGDGKADILLQHDSGLPVIWTMDGTTVTGAAVLPDVGPTWHLAAAEDFSGDGKADILLQHDSGLPVIWTMDGTTITAAATLPNPGSDWDLL